MTGSRDMSEDEEDRDKARTARAAADLKETEDLLAGFDRPGRTPRTPAVRDFVDFHLKKGSDPFAGNKDAAARGAPVAVAGEKDEKRGAPTFVLQRESRMFPSWLAWGLAMLAMVGGAATFAWCIVASNNHDGASSSTPSTSAATTISAGSAPTGVDTTSERNIPPPPPPSTMATSVSTDDLSPTSPTITTPLPTTTASTAVSPRPSSSASRPATSNSATPTSTNVPPSPSATPDVSRNLERRNPAYRRVDASSRVRRLHSESVRSVFR
jgi:hypothetical protein